LEKRAVAVILIGSLNRGDYTAFSDADIVIVVRNDYPEKFLDRVTDFTDPTLPIDVEPRVYTENE
jgi:predicted nucleotidyltransferase